MKDKTSLIIASLVLVTLIIFAGMSYVSDSNVDENDSIQPRPTTIPEQVTLIGVMDCLPHKGDGPHTLECTSGLRVNGDHFGLDLSGLPNRGIGRFNAGSKVEVSGKFTPVDEMGEDRIQVYDIEGVIEVENLTEL